MEWNTCFICPLKTEIETKSTFFYSYYKKKKNLQVLMYVNILL